MQATERTLEGKLRFQVRGAEYSVNTFVSSNFAQMSLIRYKYLPKRNHLLLYLHARREFHEYRIEWFSAPTTIAESWKLPILQRVCAVTCVVIGDHPRANLFPNCFSIV